MAEERNPPSSAPGFMLWLMTGLSGFACLVYQILWMRQAGLLFGNTSHAAALTLALFFGGLASGGWFWGRRCQMTANPLRIYAWLEINIAASGIILLFAPDIVPRLYPLLGNGFALMVFKLCATLLVVFVPSFLMGGTLPLFGQAVIRHRNSFGSITARMYAVNTVGATCGAFATAFLLIWLLGIRMTCITAMVISSVVAVIAFRLSRRESFQVTAENAMREDVPLVGKLSGKARKANAPVEEKPAMARPLIVGLAFASGFNLLALEVVWTRMLAQVHENSVYGFSTVLIIVLTCLSLGAWLASRLARSRIPAPLVLMVLIAIGGAALAMTPLIFTSVTDNLKMVDTAHPLAGYVLRLFVTGFAAIAPACLPLGAVFPFLMKGEESFITHAGKSIGTLSSINTVGAILGSLAAGFILLAAFGVWHSLQLIAAIYLLVAILMPAAANRASYFVRAASLVTLVLVLAILKPNGTTRDVLEKWEGSDCTVTVVRDESDDVSIRINSNYSLGSWQAYGSQMYQARLPLFVWPETDSVYFLGMGTGVTAGEALSRDDFPKVGRVVVCELVPSVVTASRKYFTAGPDGRDLTNGLHSDPRAQIVIADGRNHLLAHQEKFAMINADLFLPYQRGTGSLYSREHFQIVRQRLKPGGVFVQWLPLYQISELEFGIIARTMTDVFPQVSLLRGNFQPGAEIAALIGHADLTPFPASGFDSKAAKQQAVQGATYRDMQELMLPINPGTIPLFYGGNVTLAADRFAHYPLNTDDRPIIEFGTPRSLHQPSGTERPQFLESRFANLVDDLQKRTPPDKDPLLAKRSASDRKLPLAGSAFHRAWIARVHDDETSWKNEWETFLKNWLDEEHTEKSKD